MSLEYNLVYEIYLRGLFDMSEGRGFSPEVKLEIVIKALKANASVEEIAGEYGVEPELVLEWKSLFLQNAPDAFSGRNKKAKLQADYDKREKKLRKEIESLTTQVKWLERKMESVRYKWE